MKKLLLYLFSGLALFMGFAAIASADYADVPSDHPYRDAVNYLTEEKAVKGYPDGTFGIDKQINRAEFVKIVLNAAKVVPAGSDCFPDVKNEWFAPYVCKAAEMGIIKGYEDGMFRPGKDINFVEAAKIVSGVFEINSTQRYNTGNWFDMYVEALENKKAIPNSISGFGHKLTRGELTEIVYRVSAQIDSKPSLQFGNLFVASNSDGEFRADEMTVHVTVRSGDTVFSNYNGLFVFYKSHDENDCECYLVGEISPSGRNVEVIDGGRQSNRIIIRDDSGTYVSVASRERIFTRIDTESPETLEVLSFSPLVFGDAENIYAVMRGQILDRHQVGRLVELTFADERVEIIQGVSKDEFEILDSEEYGYGQRFLIGKAKGHLYAICEYLECDSIVSYPIGDNLKVVSLDGKEFGDDGYNLPVYNLYISDEEILTFHLGERQFVDLSGINAAALKVVDYSAGLTSPHRFYLYDDKDIYVFFDEADERGSLFEKIELDGKKNVAINLFADGNALYRFSSDSLEFERLNIDGAGLRPVGSSGYLFASDSHIYWYRPDMDSPKEIFGADPKTLEAVFRSLEVKRDYRSEHLFVLFKDAEHVYRIESVDDGSSSDEQTLEFKKIEELDALTLESEVGYFGSQDKHRPIGIIKDKNGVYLVGDSDDLSLLKINADPESFRLLGNSDNSKCPILAEDKDNFFLPGDDGFVKAPKNMSDDELKSLFGIDAEDMFLCLSIAKSY